MIDLIEKFKEFLFSGNYRGFVEECEVARFCALCLFILI